MNDTQFLFVYLVYILAFIGAVLMLFLSVLNDNKETEVERLQWLKKSAEFGNHDAITRLEKLEKDKSDKKKWVYWLKCLIKNQEDGAEAALTALGIHYFEQNKMEKAKIYFNRAIVMGDSLASEWLSMID